MKAVFRGTKIECTCITALSDAYGEFGWQGEKDTIWPPSTIANLSLGISLGYFVLDAAVVAWYYPEVCLHLHLFHIHTCH